MQVIKYLIVHRLFNACIRVTSNSYCYQTNNNFEKFQDLKDVENNSPITILILIAIPIYIMLIKFLKNNASKIKYNLDKTIRKRLIIV